MNNIRISILISLFSLILLSSCSDENGDNCLSPEDIANSSCPASDLLLVCDPFFCGASFPPDEENEGIVIDFFLPPLESECEVTDCTTLDCGDAGIFSELQIDQSGFPSGIISNPDGRQSPFSSCTIFN